MLLFMILSQNTRPQHLTFPDLCVASWESTPSKPSPQVHMPRKIIGEFAKGRKVQKQLVLAIPYSQRVPLLENQLVGSTQKLRRTNDPGPRVKFPTHDHGFSPVELVYVISKLGRAKCLTDEAVTGQEASSPVTLVFLALRSSRYP